MKNKLTDLNDHLFAAIERLNDESLPQDEIDKEAKRARANENLNINNPDSNRPDSNLLSFRPLGV